MRNPNRLEPLKLVLEKTDTRKIDVVVLAVKQVMQPGFGGHEFEADEVFSTDMAALFSKVVALAEKAGKHVELMVVPGGEPSAAIVQTAQRLQFALLIKEGGSCWAGRSPVRTAAGKSSSGWTSKLYRAVGCAEASRAGSWPAESTPCCFLPPTA